MCVLHDVLALLLCAIPHARWSHHSHPHPQPQPQPLLQCDKPGTHQKMHKRVYNSHCIVITKHLEHYSDMVLKHPWSLSYHVYLSCTAHERNIRNERTATVRVLHITNETTSDSKPSQILQADTVDPISSFKPYSKMRKALIAELFVVYPALNQCVTYSIDKQRVINFLSTLNR